MTPEQNKYLAEAMGLCWHEWALKKTEDYPFGIEECNSCEEVRLESTENPDFTSDFGFCLALAYAQDDSRHEWTWDRFLSWTNDYIWRNTDIPLNGKWTSSFMRYLFTPANFAPTLVQFMEEVGKWIG